MEDPLFRQSEQCQQLYSFILSDLSPRLIASVFSQRDVPANLGRFEARRGMAENRFYPIKGASHETGITEEVRDLIRNVKHAENIEKVRIFSLLTLGSILKKDNR